MGKKINVTYEVGGYIWVDDEVTAEDIYKRVEEDEMLVLASADFEVVHRDYTVWEEERY